jgi:transposase InsO family protein
MDEYLSFDRKVKLMKAFLRGASVCWICGHYGVSRKTFYYHLRNFRREGWSGLGAKSHRPHLIHSTPQKTVDWIVQLRENYGWGPNRIEGYLKQKGTSVGHSTVYRVLCKAGLNQPLGEPRKTWGRKRFQRHKPNELWQADWKLTRDDQWMITYLDDYSRFIPGCQIFENANTENSLSVLKQAIKDYGKPQQILTDQGVQFYTWQENGKTDFTKYLERKGIQHIVASKRRPTTIGKVERFNGSYEREAWRYPSLQEYIQHYNYERPHQALQYLTPANLYIKQV